MREGTLLSKKIHSFAVNQNVYVKNNQTKLWQIGKIVKIVSHCTYLVQVGGSIRFIHANDIRPNISNNIENQQGTNQKEGVPSSRPISSSKILNNNNDIIALDTPLFNAVSPQQQDREIERKEESAEVVPIKIEENKKTVNSPTVKDVTVNTPKVFKTTRSGRIIRSPVKLNL